MILLIDNYDSFSYNLYQLIGSSEPDIRVVRNDGISVEEIGEEKPDCLILSPGHGRPADAGICEEAVRTFAGKMPILGVCLGHQAICEAFGAKIGYAGRIMHGRSSVVSIDRECRIFRGLEPEIRAARYHSLAVDEKSLPSELYVTGRAEDGEVMAVTHRKYDIYGLQFHPESILTPEGRKILDNFLNLGKGRIKS